MVLECRWMMKVVAFLYMYVTYLYTDKGTILEYRNHIWRRPNRANDMQRRTRQEKRPPLEIRTDIAQLLQVPHLAYRRPPMAKQPLVKTAVFGIRPGLPAHCVSGNGREVLGVEPADGVHVALYADERQNIGLWFGALDPGGFICETGMVLSLLLFNEYCQKVLTRASGQSPFEQ